MKAKRNLILLLSAGLVCVLSMAASVWYSVSYNESRLVEPTDFATYAFRTKDLPMLLSGALTAVYVICLAVCLLRAVLKQKKEQETQASARRTRRISPKFGYLGFLGFLGFAGIWTYQLDKMVFPFCFFLFFGFFGFFYEGKMSNTLMDERFEESRRRALLTALKAGYGVMFFALLATGMSGGSRGAGLEYLAVALVITIALDCALVQFLSEYLLYRYDRADGE